ncbi:MAG: GNAT family N-acetyltransferase [Promethearchaeota archaeon]
MEKPWDETISRSALLDIMNAHFEYLASEFHVEITEEVFDRIFGKEAVLSREIIVFENEERKIIGFTRVSNISGAQPWRLIIAILPEYFETQLPQQVIESGIDLGKNLKIDELTVYTQGPLAAPFDQALENLGIHPILYLLNMHLKDLKDVENIENFALPQGVTLRNLKEVDDYEQFVSVLNEAFRPITGFQPTTIEKTKNVQEFRRKQSEIEYIFTYKDEFLIGFCIVEYDPKETVGYVQGLAVLPKYQHQGIGRNLTVAGLKQIRLKKCKRIELDAVLDNRNAVKLYQSLGFRTIEKTERRCYRINT